MPVTVVKRKLKLRAVQFNVTYEAGVTMTSDYGSRHPLDSRQYTQV